MADTDLTSAPQMRHMPEIEVSSQTPSIIPDFLEASAILELLRATPRALVIPTSRACMKLLDG